MKRVFITGSADGIGRRTASMLVDTGHEVVLHARTAQRAEVATAVAGGVCPAQRRGARRARVR